MKNYCIFCVDHKTKNYRFVCSTNNYEESTELKDSMNNFRTDNEHHFTCYCLDDEEMKNVNNYKPLTTLKL